ncbi:FHA domain-containing protein [Ramlibacter rhizophilus]|uniref:FHA domain-containing protein n=1 Tax=Ramlibacter rhizophilus TaxID=1781167 RepID=A0A4Z0BIE3_9BURK|nr:FHA domain-containing protein [Ramlibacter rhizophilus]TFY97904.1 FHA domain-containing protein [Ramlibacter rhizophilus]
MPKMIMSIDGVVIKEIQITKDRTTLGRRPYNDVVIDNLAVSGEHAVVHMTAEGVFLEDLNSTNGTYVNGKAVKRQALQPEDVVEIGRYRIKYLAEAPAPGAQEQASAAPQAAAQPPASPQAFVKVLSGAATGREVPLVKVVTTLGKPGVAVAAITRRAHGFSVNHVDGELRLVLNGEPIGAEPVTLQAGDVLELAGTRMQFVQA